MSRRGTCVACHRELRIEARGLCASCWRRDVNGTTVDFDETEDAHIARELVHIGFNPNRAHAPQFELHASRFEMSPKTLAKTWYRAQKHTTT